MKTLIAILAITLAGCATPYASHQQDPKFKDDHAYCDLESMKVSGSDSTDIAFNKGAFFAKCMSAKGYQRY